MDMKILHYSGGPQLRSRIIFIFTKKTAVDCLMVMESNLTFHHKAEMIFQDIAENFFANGQKQRL